MSLTLNESSASLVLKAESFYLPLSKYQYNNPIALVKKKYPFQKCAFFIDYRKIYQIE
jgi:hypothetical protein